MYHDDGDRQLRGPLRHPDHASRVRGERVQRARRLRLLVRQRLLRGHHRDEPLRQREEAHDSRSRRRSEPWPLAAIPKPAAAHAARAGARCWRYPDADLRRGFGELREIAARASRRCRRLASPSSTRCIDTLARAIRSTPKPTTSQLFDRGRSHVAASVRARARRFARPRPGDDRPRARPTRRRGPLPRAKASCRTTCRRCSSSRRRSRRAKRTRCSARWRTSSTRSSPRSRSAAARYASVLGALLELAGEKAQPGRARRRRAARRDLGRAAGVRRLLVEGPGAARRTPQPIRSFRGYRQPKERDHDRATTSCSTCTRIVCLTVFLMGSLVRFDGDQYTWKSDSSQLLRTGTLRWGSNLFHVGILFLFFGHVSASSRRTSSTRSSWQRLSSRGSPSIPAASSDSCASSA